MKHALTRKGLLERYVRATWILKVRLISARRQLWADQASLIHLESALLQMRKVCEGIAQMCVIASEVKTETHDPGLRKDYKVGAVFKLLSKRKSLYFPGHARLTKRDGTENPAVWDLSTTAATQDDIDRVSKINSRCGTALHEFHPLTDWPSSSDDTRQHLAINLNAVRGDHQWLWNRFWEHAITLRSSLFFVSLDDCTQASRPFVVKDNGLVEGDLAIEFDAEYLADFSGALVWSDPPTPSVRNYGCSGQARA